jgi:hypothetical protein
MSLSAMDAGTLIATCVAWLTVALALGLDLLGLKRRDLAFRWMGTGLLVMMSAGAFSQFAHVRKWPLSHLTVIDTLTLAVGLAGIVCVIVSVVIQIRSQHGEPPLIGGPSRR